MDKEDFRVWQDAVMEHSQMLQRVVDDRILLKEKIIEHLKQFFEYDDIKFTNDFSKITLKWAYENDPVIPMNQLNGLMMDFIITTTYDSELGQGVVIELYPFGVEE